MAKPSPAAVEIPSPDEDFNPFLICKDVTLPPAWTHGDLEEGVEIRCRRLEALAGLLSAHAAGYEVKHPDAVGDLILHEARIVHLMLNRALQLLKERDEVPQ